VSEFDTRFDKLHSQIPKDLCPSKEVVYILYVNAFEGKFSFILRDKKPYTLEKSKDYSTKIEENITYSKIEPFQYPRTRTEEKTKTIINNVPDPITLLD